MIDGIVLVKVGDILVCGCVCVCVYVCMCVCTYECIHACTYACMYACIHVNNMYVYMYVSKSEVLVPFHRYI